MRAFDEQAYSRAVAGFEGVIADHPGSPLLERAQWMIGRSYEAAGEFEKALTVYRKFRANFPQSVHQYEAGLRIGFLENLLKDQSGESRHERVVGRIWVGELSAAGKGPFGPDEGGPPKGEVLVIRGYGKNGVYFPTDQAPMISNRIAGIVAEAHRRGVKVWVRVPVRHLPWFKIGGEERDLAYDPVAQRRVAVRVLDWFNPGTLERLKHFLSDLARTGADGIVLDEPVFVAAWEGFGPAAQAAFKAEFGILLDPEAMIMRPARSEDLANAPESVGTDLFWRWTGWKNRQNLLRLEGVLNQVRTRHPHLTVAHFVGDSAVWEPEKALARSGIDLLEELQHGIDYIGISPPAGGKVPDPAPLVARIKNRFPEPSRLMVILPANRFPESSPLPRISEPVGSLIEN